METYSRGSLLRNGHSTHSPWGTRTHARPTHTGAYNIVVGTEKGNVGRRKRTREPKEEERKGNVDPARPPRPGPLLSYVWGTKKLSYNCCTPRGASRFPPIIVGLLARGWRNSRTTPDERKKRNPRVDRVLDRPRYRLTSSGERQPQKLL